MNRTYNLFLIKKFLRDASDVNGTRKHRETKFIFNGIGRGLELDAWNIVPSNLSA